MTRMNTIEEAHIVRSDQKVMQISLKDGEKSKCLVPSKTLEAKARTPYSTGVSGLQNHRKEIDP